MDQSWKNPNDIMKVRRIPRHSSRLSRSQSCNQLRRASHPSPKENMPDENAADSLKRRNPFSCQRPEAKQKVLKRGHSIDIAEAEVKRLVSTDFFKVDHQKRAQPHAEDEDVVTRIGKNLKSMQDRLSVQKLKEKKSAINVPSMDQSRDMSILNGLKSGNGSKESHSKPLLDWSLKTKMRVVFAQDKNDGSKKNPPGMDAKHLKAFVKGHCDNECKEWQSLDVIHKIRRCSFHYSYPNMPWMSHFPRLKSYFKSRSSFLDINNSTVISALQKDWSRVFTSVYQQLRSGSCPYFYVCTHQFTVLFRCLRSSTKCFLTALLSPSTRGFRELLKKEGISFQMPNLKADMNTACKTKEKSKSDHCKKKDSDSKQVEEGNSNSDKAENTETGYQSNDEDLFDNSNDGNEDVKSPSKNDKGNSNTPVDDGNACDLSPDEETDDDNLAADWLEDMGLDKKDFPSLRPHNVKLQQENFRDIDNRTQSMVYMEGLNVHAFFNFLLNYPGCIASSGPQYGIPPTILSPSPFLGGSLSENSVKQSVIGETSTSQQNSSRSTQSSTHCVIEICGPILPHHSLNISSIVQTCTSSSKLSYFVHSPTTAFNTDENSAEEKLNVLTTGLSKLLVPYSPDECGLLRDVQDSLCSDNCMSVREATVLNHSIVVD